MLTIGFDPSFIDTLVRVQDPSGNLEINLPTPGNHHRSSHISRIAGGNGTNIAYILGKLRVECVLVVPTNSEYESLLKQRGITEYKPIPGNVNETVGITWKQGEIQFNDVRAKLGKEHWTDKIHSLWQDSILHIYLNWGLNPQSADWVSCQWLSSCGWNYEDILEEKNIQAQALQAESTDKLIILEPGSIKNHRENDFLYSLLQHIAKENILNVYPILCCNEEEEIEFKNLQFVNKIIHTSSNVMYLKNKVKENYVVEKLKIEPYTFVGAGDAFLAGIIESCLQNSINIKNGINVAQNYLYGYYK